MRASVAILQHRGTMRRHHPTRGNAHMTLPKRVIDKDYELSKSGDDLMKLRWHWTLDGSNPKRVEFTEYARAVGRDRKIISRDAYAWEEYQQAKTAGPMGPGSARTPSDFRQLAKLSEERKQATKAIARVTGKAIATVATSKRDEVDAVVSLAQERAMKRKTTVEHEIEHVAERRERGRQA